MILRVVVCCVLILGRANRDEQIWEMDDHFPDPKCSEQMSNKVGVVRTNQLNLHVQNKDLWNGWLQHLLPTADFCESFIYSAFFGSDGVALGGVKRRAPKWMFEVGGGWSTVCNQTPQVSLFEAHFFFGIMSHGKISSHASHNWILITGYPTYWHFRQAIYDILVFKSK